MNLVFFVVMTLENMNCETIRSEFNGDVKRKFDESSDSENEICLQSKKRKRLISDDSDEDNIIPIKDVENVNEAKLDNNKEDSLFNFSIPRTYKKRPQILDDSDEELNNSEEMNISLLPDNNEIIEKNQYADKNSPLNSLENLEAPPFRRKKLYVLNDSDDEENNQNSHDQDFKPVDPAIKPIENLTEKGKSISYNVESNAGKFDKFLQLRKAKIEKKTKQGSLTANFETVVPPLQDNIKHDIEDDTSSGEDKLDDIDDASSDEDKINEELDKSSLLKSGHQQKKDLSKKLKKKKDNKLVEDTEAAKSDINFNTDIFDAEGTDDEIEKLPEYFSDDDKPEKLSKKSKSKKKESKKIRDQELLEIHSESSRLLRESSIKMPYYKPPPCTLQEFLNRRKKTPLPLNLKPFRMNTEQIIAVESMASNTELSNSNQLDKVLDTTDAELLDKDINHDAKIIENLIENLIERVSGEINHFELCDNILSVDTAFILNEIITKVSDEICDIADDRNLKSESLLLYESDDNMSNLVPEELLDNSKKESKNDIQIIKQQIFESAKTFTPKLSGAPGISIVLEDTSSPIKNDFDNFIQKFTDHTNEIRKKRATAQEVKLNIVSKDENDPSKLQCSDIFVKINAEDEDSDVDKPGTKFLKLKSQLLSEILKKKEETLIKKQETEKMYNEELISDEEELFEESDTDEDAGTINDNNSIPDNDEDVGTVNDDIENNEVDDDSEDDCDFDDGDHDLDIEDDDSMNISFKKKKKNFFIDDEASEDDDVDYVDTTSLEIKSKNSDFHSLFSDATEEKSCEESVLTTEDKISNSLDEPCITSSKSMTISSDVVDSFSQESFGKNEFPTISESHLNSQSERNDNEFKSPNSLFKEKNCDDSFSDDPFKSSSPSLFPSTYEALGIQPKKSPFWTVGKSPNTSLCSDKSLNSPASTDSKGINVSRVAKELCFANSPSNLSDVLDMCSGTFGSRAVTQKSDYTDEDDDDIENSIKPLPSDSDDELIENKIKKHKALPLNDSFIDDEEEDLNNSFKLLESDSENELEENEEEEAKEEIKGVNDFFEEEAELSGDDVGSDEDADIEDGEYEKDFIPDEELPSDEELRDQIGKVHLKRMLDDDKRELRLYQELYLEDGELHTDGPGRQRKFTWLNSNAEDFGGEHSGNSESEQEDLPGEEQWRIERHERQKFLQEQQDKESIVLENSPVLLKRQSSLKIEILNKSQEQAIVSENTTADFKNVNLSRSSSQITRSSLLARGDEYLNCFTKKIKKSDHTDSSGSKTTKHFVFRAVSPEKIQLESSELIPKKITRKLNRVQIPKQRKSIFDLLE